ncbi:MAG: Tat pathway signal protein, partial [Gemmatimonadetes bacterium]
MRRRRFIETLGRGALGAGLLSAGLAPGCERPVRGRAFDVWTWVHGDRDRDARAWRRYFARLRGAGVAAVLVSGGDTDLLSDAARAEGLAFHRWLWILNRNGDAWAQEHHPEWFTVNRLGRSSLTDPPYVGYYRWVCPTRDPVRAYIGEQIQRVAEDPAVDGVHLDYIRHCDVILPRGLWEKYGLVQDHEMPEFDYCYCDVCRPAFAAEYGTDPLELEDPPSVEAWVRFRWDSVTRLVRELAERAHAEHKPITAAVFPTPSLARALVRQAWDEWPLDGFFPMLYHGFYLEGLPWIGASVREGRAALAGSGRKLRAGLYLPDL